MVFRNKCMLAGIIIIKSVRIIIVNIIIIIVLFFLIVFKLRDK